MTAHAMAGDHDKSLEAGMNDHLTKPIDPDKLFAALLKWIRPGERQLPPGQETPRDETRPAAESLPLPEVPGLAIEAGLTRVGGNRRLYRDLLTKFATEYAESPRQVLTLLDTEDWDSARRVAHTVKGVAGSIGAEGLESVAAELEAALKERDTDSIPEKLDVFGRELDGLIPPLRAALEAQGQSGPAAAADPGDPATLRALLLELEPHVEKRRPRQTREVMEKLAGFAWTGADAEAVRDLERLVGKYRFKEARALVADVLARLPDE